MYFNITPWPVILEAELIVCQIDPLFLDKLFIISIFSNSQPNQNRYET